MTLPTCAPVWNRRWLSLLVIRCPYDAPTPMDSSAGSLATYPGPQRIPWPSGPARAEHSSDQDVIAPCCESWGDEKGNCHKPRITRAWGVPSSTFLRRPMQFARDPQLRRSALPLTRGSATLAPQRRDGSKPNALLQQQPVRQDHVLPPDLCCGITSRHNALHAHGLRTASQQDHWLDHHHRSGHEPFSLQFYERGHGEERERDSNYHQYTNSSKHAPAGSLCGQ